MQHRTSKRREIIMRSLVYALMTLSVITIVAVLMLIILGYSFNKKDGRIEQGGLLQFSSMPSGATVTVDGVPTGSRTPSKANAEAKSHNVQMTLKGYRSWQKTIALQAGGIGWLSYARLIPNDIKIDSIRTFPKLAASLATSDRKWIAIQEDLASNQFTFANLESDTPKFTTVELPQAAFTQTMTQTPQKFEVAAWSDNDDKLLIKHTYDDSKVEWIILDRQRPDESINMTNMFAINATDVKFGDNNGSDAFALTDDGIVRRVNFSNKTLSQPLAENIDEFSVYDNHTLLYVTKPDTTESKQRHVGYRTDDMDQMQTIFSYPEATPNLHIALGEYYGKKYIAVTHDLVLKVFSGTLPKDTTKANLTQISSTPLSADASQVTIGNNGRFAVAQMADSYTTYDIELLKADTTSFTRPATSPRQLKWIDEYIIASDRGGTIRLFEFDGGNQQDIMPASEGQAITLSGNEKFLYGFAPAQNGISLTRAHMQIDN